MQPAGFSILDFISAAGREADSWSQPLTRRSGRMIFNRLRYAVGKGLRGLLAAAALLATAYGAHAQQPLVSDSATIHFTQSHSGVSLAMPGNKAELDRITDFMHRYNDPDSGYVLRSVRVVGGASPEGSVSINERLSRRRAAGIFDYISQREAMPDSVATFVFLGRDWQGLRKLVAEDAEVPYRTEVLSVIDETIGAGTESAAVSDRGLSKLRELHRGIPYRYMYTHQFPALRASKLLVEYEAPARPIALPEPEIPVEPIEEDTVEIDVIPEEVVEYVPGTVDHCSPFYMGLKTNMLYDALALPTVGAEFYVGKNWSVGVNWTYGWWSKNSSHRYWRAYGGDINVRRWFGSKAAEKPLTGHHVGVYFGVVTYDFEFGGKGYMGGLPHKALWNRCNYMGGIEYGYSLPVGRRLNIDFTIGLGYMGGKYLEYEPKGNQYVWQKTMKMHWFGPTKAEVSLVWLLGCDNYNRSHKKGGNL